MPEQQTLAQRIRAKYPGVYDDITDAELEARVDAKFPGVYKDVPHTPPSAEPAHPGQKLVGMDVTNLGGQTEPAAQPELPETTTQPAAYVPGATILSDAVTGAVKSSARTALGLGRMVKKGIGRGELSPEDEQAFNPETWGLESKSKAEQVGGAAEQAAEFYAIPGPGKTRAAMKAAHLAGEGLAAAGLTSAQGGSTAEAVAAGVMGGAPVAEGVGMLGKWIGSKAEPLVRAALKPTVAALRKVTGQGGLDAKAASLIHFILENRVTTADKARDIVAEAERELQRTLSVKNAPTDAPQRAVRYLAALEKSAGKQGLPASDVATIRNAAAEVLQSSLGEDVVTMVPKPHPSLLDANGKPIYVLMPETTRVLRDSMPATEALESARASSRWQTRKAWGEQKGAQTEAAKAVERAERDAVKAAVPEAAPLLKREGQGLQAAEVLDRAQQRAANRDAVSLPAHVVAAGEIASGKPPLLAFAANWLRNNQLKAGIWADRLGKAIQRGNEAEVSFYLKKAYLAAGAPRE